MACSSRSQSYKPDSKEARKHSPPLSAKGTGKGWGVLLTTEPTTHRPGPHGNSMFKEAQRGSRAEQKRPKTTKMIAKSPKNWFASERSWVRIPSGPPKTDLFTQVCLFYVVIIMVLALCCHCAELLERFCFSNFSALEKSARVRRICIPVVFLHSMVSGTF